LFIFILLFSAFIFYVYRVFFLVSLVAFLVSFFFFSLLF